MDDEAVEEEEPSSKSTAAARLPRWTKQEILVLVQGKRVSESRVGRTRGSSHESKWAAVSSYCRSHGVDRGAVQCRKRWGNLSGDYKKIKQWEEANSSKSDETASYWAMKNDLRREKKLPRFFDREVYDVLDGSAGGSGAGAAVAAAVEEEHDGSLHPGRSPDPAGQGSDHNLNLPGGTSEDILQHDEEGRKRKRYATEDVNEEGVSLHHRLIEAVENNGRLFSSYVEAHDAHLRLDREQRKEQSNSIVAALDKLVDTLGRIADKL